MIPHEHHLGNINNTNDDELNWNVKTFIFLLIPSLIPLPSWGWELLPQMNNFKYYNARVKVTGTEEGVGPHISGCWWWPPAGQAGKVSQGIYVLRSVSYTSWRWGDKIDKRYMTWQLPTLTQPPSSHEAGWPLQESGGKEGKKRNVPTFKTFPYSSWWRQGKGNRK